MKLTRYSKYKDAGVSWIGKIPAHWSEKRAKYYFKEIDDRSQTGDEEMLSVSHITGVTLRSQKKVTMFKAESNVGQKRCLPGDLIINTMWAWMSALGVSSHAGIVSPAYGVYRLINNQEYDYYYLDHLLRIAEYRTEFTCRSTGIRSSRLRLYPDKFLSMCVICPPKEEQRLIAKYLKAQEITIRKLIRNKLRLIELLKEQKQNIIKQAVTRGCNPNAKLKSSGIDWIGVIPEFWEIRKLKFASKMIVGGATPDSGQSEFWDGEVVWITPQDISKAERLYSSERKLTSEGVISCSTVMVPSGSVVVTSRAPVGNVSLAEVELCTNQGCKSIITDDRFLLPQYCFFLLKTMQSVLEREANGTTFLEISTWAFANVKVPLPPIAEQVQIIEYVQTSFAIIEQAISRAKREIELIREYRGRLISDLVTGKVDVREIKAQELIEDEIVPLEEEFTELDEEIVDEENLDEAD